MGDIRIPMRGKGLGNSGVFALGRDMISLLGELFLQIRDILLYWREIRDAFFEIALGSLPLILPVSIFVGLSTAASALYIALPGTPPHLIGSGIFKGIILEIEPVLLGLLLVGRVGAGIASELGSMKTSEQVEALRSLGIPPSGFLVLPRIISAIIAAPLLLIIGYWFALLSASLFASPVVSDFQFLRGIKLFFVEREISVGIVKASVFGANASFFGTFFGLKEKEGARGVGHDTMVTVVCASLNLLFLNYLLNVLIL